MPEVSASRAFGDEVARARNLPQAFFASAGRKPDAPAQWQRRKGGYAPLSYREMEARVRRLTAGLIAAGVAPGDRVAILMENRPEWAALDYAILAAGAVTVPLYCSYRPQDMAFVLNDAECRAVFTSGGKLLAHLMQALKDAPSVGRVWTLDAQAGEAEGEGIAQPLAALEDSGASVPASAIDERMAGVDRDTLATLVYTSGTTGQPKGVMLSHGNILANLEAVPDVIELHDDDRLLSFLPLAHALERMASHFLVYSFGLSVAFAERPDTVAKNLIEARPTIMVSVPRMLEVVRSRILAQAAKQKGVGKVLFDMWLKRGLARAQGGRGGFGWRLLDRLVGGKLRERFGGRLRAMVSGGAPLAAEVELFFEVVGIPVLQGYGLSETAPLLTVNPYHDRRPGTVGPAVRGVELRIAEDGEILARGPNVMAGYWRRPEDTRAVLDDEGWFHTGDIGEMDADGWLRITDRKKDIIVNSGGENIAPQRIESLLATDAMIAQAVVYGDQRPYLVALIVPDRENALAWASGQGLPESDWETLAASRVLRKELQNRINRMLAPLNSFEQVRRIIVLPEPFTVESGLLTPTMKIKRRKVYARYREALEGLYSG